MTHPIICGVDDVPDVLGYFPDAALISIRGNGQSAREWARGRPNTLCLFFDDVDEDKPRHGYFCARKHDVEHALTFGRSHPDHRLVVHCAAGVSRSSATVLAILADRLGPGREAEACEQTIAAHNASVDECLRPYGFGISPNSAVVRLADDLLARGGALVRAWQQTPWLTTKSHGNPGGNYAPASWVTDHQATAALREMVSNPNPRTPSTVRPDWVAPVGIACPHGPMVLEAHHTGEGWWLGFAPDECVCDVVDLDGSSAWPFVEPVASASDLRALGFEVV